MDAGGRKPESRLIPWSSLSNCSRRDLGVRVGDKRFRYALRVNDLYVDDSGPINIAIVAAPGATSSGTFIEYFQNQALTWIANKGLRVTDENGATYTGTLRIKGFNVPKKGFIIFGRGPAPWFMKKGSTIVAGVTVSNAILVTERHVLYACEDTKIAVPEPLSICGIRFRGRMQVEQDGIRIVGVILDGSL